MLASRILMKKAQESIANCSTEKHTDMEALYKLPSLRCSVAGMWDSSKYDRDAFTNKHFSTYIISDTNKYRRHDCKRSSPSNYLLYLLNYWINLMLL